MEHRPVTAEPTAAVLAATALTGIGTATVETALLPAWGSRNVPVLHAQTAEGTTYVAADADVLPALGLVSRDAERSVHAHHSAFAVHSGHPAEHGPAGAPATGMAVEVPAVLQVRVMAPVVDLTVFRAEVRVTGWLRHVAPYEVPVALRALCDGVPLGDVVGYRAATRLLCFAPHHATVHTEDGATPVSAAELDGALPDPLSGLEGRLIPELEDRFAGRLPALFASALAAGAPARTLCTGEGLGDAGPCAACPRRCTAAWAPTAGFPVRLVGVSSDSVTLCAVRAADEVRCRATDQLVLTLVRLTLPRPVAGLADAVAALGDLAGVRTGTTGRPGTVLALPHA